MPLAVYVLQPRVGQIQVRCTGAYAQSPSMPCRLTVGRNTLRVRVLLQFCEVSCL
jgi:hypothetical protein